MKLTDERIADIAASAIAGDDWWLGFARSIESVVDAEWRRIAQHAHDVAEAYRAQVAELERELRTLKGMA